MSSPTDSTRDLLIWLEGMKGDVITDSMLSAAKGLLGVAAEFLSVSGTAGIVSRGHQSAAAEALLALESTHVIALPAVH